MTNEQFNILLDHFKKLQNSDINDHSRILEKLETVEKKLIKLETALHTANVIENSKQVNELRKDSVDNQNRDKNTEVRVAKLENTLVTLKGFGYGIIALNLANIPVAIETIIKIL